MKIASPAPFAPGCDTGGCGRVCVLDRVLLCWESFSATTRWCDERRSSLEAKNRFSIINHQKKSERTHSFEVMKKRVDKVKVKLLC